MSWPGTEPQSPRPLVNTLPTRPMDWYIKVYKLLVSDSNTWNHRNVCRQIIIDKTIECELDKKKLGEKNDEGIFGNNLLKYLMEFDCI